MMVGVIWAVAVVSAVTTALRVTSAVPPARDQRKARVWSAPRRPRTRATRLVWLASSTVPLSNWRSAPAPEAWAVTEAIAAGGPLKVTWFQGSARVILATSSNLNWYGPGLDTNRRY